MLNWQQFYSTCKGVRMPQPNEGDPERIVIGKEDFERILQESISLNDDTRFIFGMNSLNAGPISHTLRKGGHVMNRRIEDEQVYVIHWMLSEYFTNPLGWRERCETELIRCIDVHERKEALKN